MMKDKFYKQLKAEVAGLLGEDIEFAVDIAKRLLLTHDHDFKEWFNEEARRFAQVVRIVEEILRELDITSAGIEQMDLPGDIFKDTFEKNPGLPRILSVPSEDGRMRYRLVTKWNNEELEQSEEYTQLQEQGLRERRVAVRRYRAYRRSLGIPDEASEYNWRKDR